jgi:maltooligosyltrehalose synthase
VVRRFRRRFQQLTGPVMAKSLEERRLALRTVSPMSFRSSASISFSSSSWGR